MTAMKTLFLLMLLPSGCAVSAQQDPCPQVPRAFAQYVTRTLTDSTGMFKGDFPPVTPLSCELLGFLQEELKDDSARYCFERFARQYWNEDPHARTTHTYIRRHLSFSLAMAATAHWFADTRIEGLKELLDYRRARPQVCATRDAYEHLQRQDSAAVRYLIRVLETTPLWIPGSENSTIHSIYITEVVLTLDRFTGQQHSTTGDMHRRFDMSDERVRQALADWRKWLEQ